MHITREPRESQTLPRYVPLLFLPSVLGKEVKNGKITQGFTSLLKVGKIENQAPTLTTRPKWAALWCISQETDAHIWRWGPAAWYRKTDPKEPSSSPASHDLLGSGQRQRLQALVCSGATKMPLGRHSLCGRLVSTQNTDALNRQFMEEVQTPASMKQGKGSTLCMTVQQLRRWAGMTVEATLSGALPQNLYSHGYC